MNVMQSMEEPPEHTQLNIHLRISLYFIPVVQNYLKIKAERNCLNFTIPKHKWKKQGKILQDLLIDKAKMVWVPAILSKSTPLEKKVVPVQQTYEHLH